MTMDDARLLRAKSSFPENMSAPADAVGVNGIAFGSRNHQSRFFGSGFRMSWCPGEDTSGARLMLNWQKLGYARRIGLALPSFQMVSDVLSGA
ncbi:hypothetical protein [Rhizobium mongolense]|uniref:Uncharacterized protein n=1 Tax=Rhizobium mongolense TaxID=57676 RepID=A0A7W6RVW0_9HYPH|nr:hypothetical protein [Rhizobium mongolense]MBB4279610.1 hypothetical protein [Rhizobium mongolense]